MEQQPKEGAPTKQEIMGHFCLMLCRDYDLMPQHIYSTKLMALRVMVLLAQHFRVKPEELMGEMRAMDVASSVGEQVVN